MKRHEDGYFWADPLEVGLLGDRSHVLFKKRHQLLNINVPCETECELCRVFIALVEVVTRNLRAIRNR